MVKMATGDGAEPEVPAEAAREALWRAIQGSNRVTPAKTNSQGCVLLQHAARRDGYVYLLNVLPEARGKDFAAHRLAIIASDNGEQLAGGKHASHLCHNAKCVNPSHLIAEDNADNQKRKPCTDLHIAKCQGCGHVYNPCPHTPQCIPRSMLGPGEGVPAVIYGKRFPTVKCPRCGKVVKDEAVVADTWTAERVGVLFQQARPAKRLCPDLENA